MVFISVVSMTFAVVLILGFCLWIMNGKQLCCGSDGFTVVSCKCVFVIVGKGDGESKETEEVMSYGERVLPHLPHYYSQFLKKCWLGLFLTLKSWKRPFLYISFCFGCIGKFFFSFWNLP